MTPAARAQLYAFFSRLWVKEVDAAFLEVLRGPFGREVLPGVEAFEGLDEDFAHLTIVDLAPYESFFRREDGLLEAGAVNPASRFLAQYGFEADLAAARSLAPDHLGIELELMAVLCGREAAGGLEDAAVTRRVERAFLTEHLLTWAPLYLFAARRTARTPLYRAGAEATLQYLWADLEALT